MAVIDASNVLTSTQKVALNNKLVRWQQRTKHQLVVVTVPDLKGQSLQTYSYQLGRLWRLGQTGVNDGVILILATGDKKARIEVGVGLEAVLTDAQSFQLLHTVIYPKLKAKNTYGALDSGVDAIATYIDTHEGDVKRNTASPKSSIPWTLILLCSVILGAIIFCIRRNRKLKVDSSAPSDITMAWNKPYFPPPSPVSSTWYSSPPPPSPNVSNPYLSSDGEASNLITGMAIGSILSSGTNSSDDDKNRYTPVEESPLGFTSNNEDDRSFGGGGAEISYGESDSSDSDSNSSDSSSDSSDD
jgi:uncharacterized membrane protein YgcG